MTDTKKNDLTPKERASKIVYDIFDFTDHMQFGEAKELAIYFVDDTIDILVEISVMESGMENIDYGQRYWREVKQEIESL